MTRDPATMRPFCTKCWITINVPRRQASPEIVCEDCGSTWIIDDMERDWHTPKPFCTTCEKDLPMPRVPRMRNSPEVTCKDCGTTWMINNTQFFFCTKCEKHLPRPDVGNDTGASSSTERLVHPCGFCSNSLRPDEGQEVAKCASCGCNHHGSRLGIFTCGTICIHCSDRWCSAPACQQHQLWHDCPRSPQSSQMSDTPLDRADGPETSRPRRGMGP